MGEERYKSEFQISENDIAQAKSMCAFYDDVNIRKKAFCSYIALGTLIDYIKRLGLEISPHTSISRVMKIVEDFDVTNVSYSDLQLDVRVSVNSDYIFIPKIHFDYGITPDIYIGAKLSSDFKKIEFLGYVETSQIQNAPLNNDGFYYLKSEELSPFENLITALQKNSETAVYYDDEECEQISELFLKYFDDSLNQNEKIYLVKHLMSCLACKCRFIDFYEFDILMKKYKDYKDIYAEYQKNNENFSESPQTVLNFEQMADDTQNVTENIPVEAIATEQIVQSITENTAANTTETVIENVAEEIITTAGDEIENATENIENIIDKTSETIEDLINTTDDILDLSDDINLSISDNIDDITLNDIADIKTDEPETKSILKKITPPEELQEQITETAPEEIETQNDELVFDDNNIEEVLDFSENKVEDKENIIEKEEESAYQEVEIDSDEDSTEQEKNTMLTDDVFEIKEDNNSSDNLEFEENTPQNINDEIKIIEEETVSDEMEPATVSEPEPIAETPAASNQEQISNEQIKELYTQSQVNEIPQEIEDAIYAPKKGLPAIVKGGIILLAAAVITSISALTFLPAFKKPAQNDAPIEQEKLDNLSGLESQNPTGEDDMPEPVGNDTNSSQNMNNAMAGGFSGHNSMIISKISWSVSAQIAQITQVKNYLQALGKDIQINLQNDLDQAADFSYNDKIKVGMTISESGKVKNIKIVNGSGSPEIDKIIKDSITQTVEARNFPVMPQIKGDTNFNLIIIF